MQTEGIFIVRPAPMDQVKALTAFVKAPKMNFEVTTERAYNADFVAKIQESKKQFEEGKFPRVEKDDLQEFLVLK